MKNLLENTSIFLFAGLLLGFIFPEIAKILQPHVTLFLVVLMALSMRAISFKNLKIKENSKPVMFSLFLNYIVLSGILLIMGLFFIDNPEYFKGFFIAALVPPAIAVIAYNYLLKGNNEIAVIAEVLGYLLSLFIIPLGVLLVFGQSVDLYYLIWTVFILIFAPLVISRFLKFECSAFNYCKIAINILFLLLFFTLVGINQETILTNYIVLSAVIFAGVIKTYIMPLLIFKFFKCPPNKIKDKITFSLFSSVKNMGAAAVIALTLFGETAALIPVLLMITEIPVYFFFEIMIKTETCNIEN